MYLSDNNSSISELQILIYDNSYIIGQSAPLRLPAAGLLPLYVAEAVLYVSRHI